MSWSASRSRNEIADALGTTQEDVRDAIEGRRKMSARAEERPAHEWNLGATATATETRAGHPTLGGATEHLPRYAVCMDPKDKAKGLGSESPRSRRDPITGQTVLEMALDVFRHTRDGRIEVVHPAVRRLSARGWTVDEVADALGMPTWQVCAVLEKHGNTTNEPERTNEPTLAEGRFAQEMPRHTENWYQGRLVALRAAVPGLFARGLVIDEVAEILSATKSEVREVLESFR